MHVFSSCENLGIDCQQITKANGWTTAVFHRDPVDRYLSAFRSKCLASPHNFQPGRAEDNGSNCNGPVLANPHATLSEQVEAFEHHALIDVKHGKPGANIHWVSQKEVLQRTCGLPDGAFQFIGSMNEILYPQVESMLQKANHPNASIISNDMFNKMPSHCTACADSEAKAFLRNHTIVKMLSNLYKDDNDFFKSRPRSLEKIQNSHGVNQIYDIKESSYGIDHSMQFADAPFGKEDQ